MAKTGADAELKNMNRLGIKTRMRPGVEPVHKEITAFLQHDKTATLTEKLSYMTKHSIKSFMWHNILADTQEPRQRAIYIGQTARNINDFQNRKLVETKTNETAQLFKLLIGGMRQSVIEQILPAGGTWTAVATDVIAFEKELASIQDRKV